jgi:hypothetical protein
MPPKSVPCCETVDPRWAQLRFDLHPHVCAFAGFDFVRHKLARIDRVNKARSASTRIINPTEVAAPQILTNLFARR